MKKIFFLTFYVIIRYLRGTYVYLRTYYLCKSIEGIEADVKVDLQVSMIENWKNFQLNVLWFIYILPTLLFLCSFLPDAL